MPPALAFTLLTILVSTVPQLAQAQQPGRASKLAILEPGFSPKAPAARAGCNVAFHEGLRKLGWIDGQNVQIHERFGEFQPDRLQALAAELVAAAPAVIWTHSPPAAHAAKNATNKIPIVVGVASDLVEQGLVSGSLARPLNNVTGMELRDLEIMGKRLQLLKEALPSVSRVAVLADPTNSTHVRVPANIEPEARALKIQFHRVEAGAPDQIESAIAAIRGDALLIPEGAMFSQNRRRIFDSANRKRLPTAAGGQQFAEAGSLLSYGANIADTCRRSAALVDKILKGSKPEDVPVERPARFDFWINIKTAKQIGVTVPPNVLARADRVIR